LGAGELLARAEAVPLGAGEPLARAFGAGDPGRFFVGVAAEGADGFL